MENRTITDLGFSSHKTVGADLDIHTYLGRGVNARGLMYFRQVPPTPFSVPVTPWSCTLWARSAQAPVRAPAAMHSWAKVVLSEAVKKGEADG
jgi:hypothetical protein